MLCIKCGRETEENQVFCPACLASAQTAPVKPGTPVTIPSRPRKIYSTPVKAEKPEEIILRLRRQMRILRLTIVALLISLIFCVAAIIFHYSTTDHNAFAIGQNYSTESVDDAPRRR